MNQGRQLRWGVLGVAKILERLKPAFHASTTARCLGIASRSMEKAKEGAKKYGFEKPYDSYEALLADPDIDAVYIPLPNSYHAEWTQKAALAGKHILCEKPLCPSAAEAAELVTFCRSTGVKLMDGFMWPHHPRTKELRQLIDSGKIGEIKRVNGAFTFKMEELNTKNIRLQPDLGGGSLLDVGCYPIYGIRWAFGQEPVKVFAQANTVNGVDVEMTGQLIFADGRHASFDCGFTAPLRGWLEIVGTEGTIHVPEMWVPKASEASYTVTPNNQEGVRHLVPGHEQMVHMLDELAHAVWENREPRPGPDEAVKTLRVLDALTRSAQTGKMVDV
jgi:xylose dehydrogenase (NAD/NADP)